jgi:hypothetical protein
VLKDLHGQLVTGEALLTQRELSKLIIEAAGDSLGLVKDNQPTRRADIERLLAPEQVPLGAAPWQTDFQSATTLYKAHGRLHTHPLTPSALLNPTRDCPLWGKCFNPSARSAI